MDFGIYPILTKDYILERIGQEQIMEFYLGISVKVDTLIKSPLRKDDNPTCSFYYNQHGRLRFRDFSGHFWGDCFDVVAYVLNVNSKDKKAFQLILHTIAKDFKIHKYANTKEIQKYDKITKDFFSAKKAKAKLIIKIIPREYNYHDDNYWMQFNVNRNLLVHGKVYAAEEIYFSKDGYTFTKVYNYSRKDPAYCYFGGKGTFEIDDWKVYYPFRRKQGEQRFHSNSSFIQGKHLIKGGKIGVITKAYKDVLSFRSFGIQAIAPPAESVLLSKSDYDFMKSKFNILISCMDYDYAGIRMAQQLKYIYGIQPYMFTNGRFNTINYGSKDFAEYVNNNGIEKTKLLIKQLYKIITT